MPSRGGSVEPATRRAWLGRGAERTTSGRLLLFDPEDSLSDGAAHCESEGFFDVRNVPAWDTWVWYAEDDPGLGGPTLCSSHLVAWVPPQVLGLAEAGVRANPEQCIRWASEVDNAFTRRLRTAGLLS